MILHEDIIGTPLNNLKDLGNTLLQFRQEFGPVQLTLFKSAIAEAFHLMPLYFHWQIKQINTVDQMCSVDRNVPFGGCRSSKIWCSFNTLVIWIAINIKALELLFAYTDDKFSFDLTGNVSYYEKYNTCLRSKQNSSNFGMNLESLTKKRSSCLEHHSKSLDLMSMLTLHNACRSQKRN
jgi:hypothetical protein